MAKLSAKGRKEIIRFSKEHTVKDDSHCISGKTVFAIMDDRTILKKRISVWKDQYSKSGTKRLDEGWKVEGRFKKDIDLNESAQKYFKLYEEIGYTKEV